MLSVLEVMMMRMAPPDERESMYASFDVEPPGLGGGTAVDPETARARARRSGAAERDQNSLMRL